MQEHLAETINVVEKQLHGNFLQDHMQMQTTMTKTTIMLSSSSKMHPSESMLVSGQKLLDKTSCPKE